MGLRVTLWDILYASMIKPHLFSVTCPVWPLRGSWLNGRTATKMSKVEQLGGLWEDFWGLLGKVVCMRANITTLRFLLAHWIENQPMGTAKSGLRVIAPRGHRQMEGGTQGPRSAHRRFNGLNVQIRSPPDRRRDAISVFRL